MHTILGAGGPVSNALTRILEAEQTPVRLVSRRPVATTGSTTWQGADLKQYKDLLAAARGASVIYLCAGLRYDKNVWAAEWPLIMENVINVTKETGARLIFFDNVYMYGRVQGPMQEDTPYNPCSRKGEIRAGIADRLMEEARSGNIRASIARAADFYGAESKNSFFDLMVLDRLAKGSKAQWMGDINTLHAFTYVPDAAKGMALLGRRPEGDNRIWHLPTAPALRGTEFLALAAKTYDRRPGYMRISKLMLQGIGLFNKLIGETAEMYYQYDIDYIFDSGSFQRTFGLQPTSYEQGIKTLSQTMYPKSGR